MKTISLGKWCFFFLLLLLFVSAKAQKSGKSIYMFAISEDFCDTVMYVTDIQPVEGAALQNKTKFLLGRAQYSQQLKNYLTVQKGAPNQMVAVYFNKNKNKLEKELRKLKKRIAANRKVSLVVLPQSEFQFEELPPIYDNNQASQRRIGASTRP